MWRAFFYACGIMLIIVGLECILVGRFLISNQSAISRVMAKVLGNDAATSTPTLPAVSPMANGYGAQSQFGPSRFNDHPFAVASNDRGAKNPFSLATQRADMPVAKPTKPGTTIHTEDWMPWSLIAAGTIVTLYTHSLRTGSPPH